MWEKLKLCHLAQSPGLKDVDSLFQLKNVLPHRASRGFIRSKGEPGTEVHENAGMNCSSVSDMYFPLVSIKLIIDGSDTTITRNYFYYLVFLILICIIW